ncbi:MULTISPECIES: efflux RND transporter periplasmic adaptor subunit [unclassified Variovorax]|uniref:efflux RND transporter periplasmic adaptor subunit n=1 Tax=unclassified Variovorax TaxID=663243 RepID=UPI00076C7F19|nr:MULTISPECIES: efflux RND transporter periplasmic adaptor subunit [unclassified Variovorax]KWT84302.1 putative Co/Zn/Cd efflux system membrane fusion protein [Variovorax sp. WDL1]PNG52790.1 Multidrug resistance protein MdtA [Variovorax sp. B4]PNG55329.1 Multidrug resistance protein MdtA [Variovorax sp. B2]VTV09071.1 Multidrug transporter MdtA [Variovorax sp. WDL1]
MTASSASPIARRAGLLLVAALALAGCSRPQPVEEPVRAVKVMAVGTSAYDTEPEFSAEVRARVESRLGFRVAGKITRRQAELGQQVKAGQVLAQLDPQDYRLAAEAARAQHAAALTNRDLAQADLKRYRGLREQNFISAAELERRESTYKAAQAQLEQAQAQMASQGNQAQYTTLVADVPGIITAIEAEPGQVVTAGAPVVRIAQDGARDVVFSVPEDRAALVTPGSAVAVRGWSGGQELQGKVREVAASADAVTRTYTVKVAIDAATAPALGATVYARPQALSRSGTPVLKLPTSALRQEGKGSAVWVLDKPSMTVRSQPVKVTTADGNEAVIGSGLAPGTLVVVAGVHVLSPGQKVSIYREKTAEPAAGTQEAVNAPGHVTPVSSTR